jgi:hypothetical protein
MSSLYSIYPQGAISTVTRGTTFYKADGLTSAATVIAWRAPYRCEVIAVRGYRSGGSGATINSRRNGTDAHLASNLSISSANTWIDGGAVQNVTYEIGDKLEVQLVTVVGSPQQVAVQVDLRKL